MDINDISLVKENDIIVLPEVDSNWYDIATLDELVAGLIVTASNKSYEISGEVTLKALGFIDALSIPFTAKIKVEEDGSFELYAHLDYSKALLASTLIYGKKTSYYYKDGYIIIDTYYTHWFTTKHESIKITSDEFLGNIQYYVFDFGMRLSDTILNSMDSGESNSNSIDASKVLTGYSASGKNYNISLNIGELTGVSGLGDLSCTIELNEVLYNNDIKVDAVTKISSLKMKMFSILTIELNNPISLKNLEEVDGALQFVNVDMTEYINYFYSYDYEIGVIHSY